MPAWGVSAACFWFGVLLLWPRLGLFLLVTAGRWLLVLRRVPPVLLHCVVGWLLPILTLVRLAALLRWLLLGRLLLLVAAGCLLLPPLLLLLLVVGWVCSLSVLLRCCCVRLGSSCWCGGSPFRLAPQDRSYVHLDCGFAAWHVLCPTFEVPHQLVLRLRPSVVVRLV